MCVNVRGGLAPAGGGKVEGTVGVPERAVREVRSGVSPLAGPSVECFFLSPSANTERFITVLSKGILNVRVDAQVLGALSKTRTVVYLGKE